MQGFEERLTGPDFAKRYPFKRKLLRLRSTLKLISAFITFPRTPHNPTGMMAINSIQLIDTDARNDD